MFFKSDETHARSLAIDREGNLIVGTEPGGLVMRVSPKGEGFVLYQMPKREVTALAIGAADEIYAAAVGNKTASRPHRAFAPDASRRRRVRRAHRGATRWRPRPLRSAHASQHSGRLGRLPHLASAKSRNGSGPTPRMSSMLSRSIPTDIC